MNQRQNYNTRNSNQIITHNYRTTTGKNNIIRSAANTYNTHINNINQNDSIDVFKNKIKKTILETT